MCDGNLTFYGPGVFSSTTEKHFVQALGSWVNESELGGPL